MRKGEPGWFASLLGAAVLIAGGFALGLVAGVVSEEPELVVGHLVGRSDEVAWTSEGEPEFTPASDETILVAVDEADRWDRVSEVDESGEADLTTFDDPGGAPPFEVELPAVAAAPPSERASSPLSAPLASGHSSAGSSAVRDVSRVREQSFQAHAPRSGSAVQVGAFADGGAAEDLSQKLRRRGFETYVVPASESGDGKWRVRVGPVPSKAAAESLASRLKSEERLPTWVLSEGGG